MQLIGIKFLLVYFWLIKFLKLPYFLVCKLIKIKHSITFLPLVVFLFAICSISIFTQMEIFNIPEKASTLVTYIVNAFYRETKIQNLQII